MAGHVPRTRGPFPRGPAFLATKTPYRAVVSFVAAGTESIAASGNLTPGLPAGVQQDDILILVEEAKDNVAIGLPAGWTIFVENDNGAQHLAIAWAKYNTGDTAPTVTHAAGANAKAVILAFRAANTTNPIDVLGTIQADASAANPTAPAITPSVQEFVVAVGTRNNAGTSVATLSGDNLTWVEDVDSVTQNTTLAVDHASAGPAPFALTNKTFTVTGGSAGLSQGVMFSLRPAQAIAPADLGTLQSDGLSDGSLALTAPTQVPLDAANAISSATLDLTAPFVPPPRRIMVSQARERALRVTRVTRTRIRTIPAPTAPTFVLSSDAVSSATLALTAPTQIPLDAAAGVSTASLALTAPTQIVLQAAAGVSTATLVLTALEIPLGPASHGEGVELLLVRARAREFSTVGALPSDTMHG